MWRRDRDPAAGELVVSCEAFVSGRYAELLIEHERAVPVWAWVNRLAHGTDSQLRETVMIGGARVPAAMRLWWAARSYLAGEVLDRAPRLQPLRHLQSAVLVPLELELAARGDVAEWRPAQLVAAVLAGLDQRRPSNRPL